MSNFIDFIKYLFREWKFADAYLSIAFMLLLAGFTLGILFDIPWQANGYHLGAKMILVGLIMFLLAFINVAMVIPLRDAYVEFNKERLEKHNKLLEQLKSKY